VFADPRPAFHWPAETSAGVAQVGTGRAWTDVAYGHYGLKLNARDQCRRESGSRGHGLLKRKSGNSCTRGAIFDVAVDVRAGSPSYGKWVGIELSADSRSSVYIPAGFAHGYQTLTDDAEVRYCVSERYHPEAERGVRWDDPDLAIAWPKASQRVISRRDQALPRLRDL
jgi:dTDP-4-dehydrorhamnose 3,5-epimerase